MLIFTEKQKLVEFFLRSNGSNEKISLKIKNSDRIFTENFENQRDLWQNRFKTFIFVNILNLSNKMKSIFEGFLK